MLSQVVEIVVFNPFHTVLAVDLILFQVFEKNVLIFPQTVLAVVFILFQADEQTFFIPSNFSEKKSVILCQVSLIPCHRPSTRNVPISANTFEGECIPRASLKPSTKPLTKSVIALIAVFHPSTMPSHIACPTSLNHCLISFSALGIVSVKNVLTFSHSSGIVCVKKFGSVSVKKVLKDDFTVSHTSGSVSVKNFLKALQMFLTAVPTL